jgi:regulator of protease activity HflC (stomatin/prohibitin superfamily)
VQARGERLMRAFWERYHIRIIISILLVLFLVAYFWNNIVYTIDSGHAGVRWSRFFGGTVLDKVYHEGTQIILPWDKMYIYNIRLQEMHDLLTVLSKNGLSIDVDWSGRFYLKESQLPYLHKYIGSDYLEKVVKPEYVSALRTVLGNYSDEEIYSKDEEGLIDEMEEQVKKNIVSGAVLAKGSIVFDQILLKSLRLPEQTQKAIQDKVTYKHVFLSYEFQLQTEEQEKQRKTIEAEGIQQFEAISGLSILKWRGIQATERLAQSANSKIIIIGTSSEGLPILLNTDK